MFSIPLPVVVNTLRSWKRAEKSTDCRYLLNALLLLLELSRISDWLCSNLRVSDYNNTPEAFWYRAIWGKTLSVYPWIGHGEASSHLSRSYTSSPYLSSRGNKSKLGYRWRKDRTQLVFRRDTRDQCHVVSVVGSRFRIRWAKLSNQS